MPHFPPNKPALPESVQSSVKINKYMYWQQTKFFCIGLQVPSRIGGDGRLQSLKNAKIIAEEFGATTFC
jgi:hypothetical protein